MEESHMYMLAGILSAILYHRDNANLEGDTNLEGENLEGDRHRLMRG
jgi:hypothetical protein